MTTHWSNLGEPKIEVENFAPSFKNYIKYLKFKEKINDIIINVPKKPGMRGKIMEELKNLYDIKFYICIA
jgi:hypothetical protein